MALYEGFDSNSQLIYDQLKRSLKGTSARVDEILMSEWGFLSKVNDVTDAIYATDKRDRTYEDIWYSTAQGELGELAIKKLIDNVLTSCEHNDERGTGEYYWDLKLTSLISVPKKEIPQVHKIEVKQQTTFVKDNKLREYFSFNHPEKDAELRAHWPALDFVFAWFFGFDSEAKLCIYPWLLMKAVAFKEFYVRSTENPGYYMQMNKASDNGMLYYLNRIRNSDHRKALLDELSVAFKMQR